MKRKRENSEPDPEVNVDINCNITRSPKKSRSVPKRTSKKAKTKTRKTVSANNHRLCSETGTAVKRIKLKHSKRRASIVYSFGSPTSNDSLNVSTIICSDDEDEEPRVWKPCTPTPRGGTDYWDVFSSPFDKVKEPVEKPRPATRPVGPLRPIIIDGINVAFGHGCKKEFSAAGVEMVWRFFVERGHDVKIIMPIRWKSNCSQLSELEEKDSLHYFTPEEGAHYLQYIRYLVMMAAKYGAIIVSRDTFDDLLQNGDEAFIYRATVTNRLLQYTFVEDVLLFPEDPMGRYGPTLEEFLAFPVYNCYKNVLKMR